MVRLLSFLCLLLALAVLGSDLMPLLTGQGAFRLSDVGEWWFWLHPGSLQLLEPAVARYLSPAIWDPGITTVLLWPLSAVLLALAAILWLLRPRRKPPRRRDLDLTRK